jgi:hypothetical protein
MKRRLLNVVTLVSLLLCVSASVLWVRSRDQMDWLEVRTSSLEKPGYYVFHTYRGRVFCFAYHTPRVGPAPRWRLKTYPYLPGQRYIYDKAEGFAGFEWGLTWIAPDWFVGAPLWFAVAAALPFPLLRLRGWQRHRRAARRGLCQRCGYDLTGNVSGACPECGSGVTVKETTWRGDYSTS